MTRPGSHNMVLLVESFALSTEVDNVHDERVVCHRVVVCGHLRVNGPPSNPPMLCTMAPPPSSAVSSRLGHGVGSFFVVFLAPVRQSSKDLED